VGNCHIILVAQASDIGIKKENSLGETIQASTGAEGETEDIGVIFTSSLGRQPSSGFGRTCIPDFNPFLCIRWPPPQHPRDQTKADKMELKHLVVTWSA
jgi:hypothetical protein